MNNEPFYVYVQCPECNKVSRALVEMDRLTWKFLDIKKNCEKCGALVEVTDLHLED